MVFQNDHLGILLSKTSKARVKSHWTPNNKQIGKLSSDHVFFWLKWCNFDVKNNTHTNTQRADNI